jgi:hypothetical protein
MAVCDFPYEEYALKEIKKEHHTVYLFEKNEGKDQIRIDSFSDSIVVSGDLGMVEFETVSLEDVFRLCLDDFSLREYAYTYRFTGTILRNLSEDLAGVYFWELFQQLKHRLDIGKSVFYRYKPGDKIQGAINGCVFEVVGYRLINEKPCYVLREIGYINERTDKQSSLSASTIDGHSFNTDDYGTYLSYHPYDLSRFICHNLIKDYKGKKYTVIGSGGGEDIEPEFTFASSDGEFKVTAREAFRWTMSDGVFVPVYRNVGYSEANWNIGDKFKLRLQCNGITVAEDVKVEYDSEQGYCLDILKYKDNILSTQEFFDASKKSKKRYPRYVYNGGKDAIDFLASIEKGSFHYISGGFDRDLLFVKLQELYETHEDKLCKLISDEWRDNPVEQARYRAFAILRKEGFVDKVYDSAVPTLDFPESDFIEE